MRKIQVLQLVDSIEMQKKSTNDITRISLILRVRDTRDAESWEEFVQIYEPMIQNIAARLGLSPEDREDASQTVLVNLTKSIDQWNSDSEQASFRGWLYRVAKNTILNYLKSKSHRWTHHHQTGNEHMIEKIDQLDAGYEIEFLRQAMLYLAQKIKSDFEPTNWSAFWLTYSQQMTVEEAATELGISKSRVYVARSRIIKRLKLEALRLNEDDWLKFDDTMSSILAIETPSPSDTEDPKE